MEEFGPGITGSAKILGELLKASYPEREARQISRLWAAHVAGINLNALILYPEEDFTREQLKHFRLGAERLLSGEPLQYVVGSAPFFGRDLCVEPGVLIPRPETEELCAYIIKVYPRPKPLILDVGTGSGCIALTLALELPGSAVRAVDLSPEALRIAARNATALGAQVEFLQMDVLTAEKGAFSGLDIVVSNPPYVTAAEAAEMAGNVLAHEPHEALFVPDEDPLRFYRAIGAKGRQWLRPGGALFFELNERFGEATRRLIEGMGYEKVEIVQDMQGKDRILAAWQPL